MSDRLERHDMALIEQEFGISPGEWQWSPDYDELDGEIVTTTDPRFDMAAILIGFDNANNLNAHAPDVAIPEQANVKLASASKLLLHAACFSQWVYGLHQMRGRAIMADGGATAVAGAQIEEVVKTRCPWLFERYCDLNGGRIRQGASYMETVNGMATLMGLLKEHCRALRDEAIEAARSGA